MGTVVLSIDAELAWGFHDQSRLPDDRLRAARSGWITLLDLLDEYHMPATWALVGHLMLDSCDGVHAGHPAPPGWFDRDPGGNRFEHPLWYAPELIETIQAADVDHELASHTFSHIPFGHPDVTAEIVDAELSRHVSLAEEWGFTLRSLVFPRNQVGYLDRLATHGFTCYRGIEPNSDSILRKPRKAFEMVGGGGPPPVTQPRIDVNGLVNIPATIDLFGFEGVAKQVVEPLVGDPIVTTVEAGIEAAIEHDAILHGWLHPNNIKSEADRQRLERIFQAIQSADVTVDTMGGIADASRLEANV